MKLLDLETVIAIHTEIVKNNRLIPEIIDEIDLKLILSVFDIRLFGDPVYYSGEEVAIMYVYYLIKRRPFLDGNKRVALACWVKFYDINYYRYSQESLSNIEKLINLIDCDIITKADLLYASRCLQSNEWGKSLLSKR